jgi:hypothetical protein
MVKSHRKAHSGKIILSDLCIFQFSSMLSMMGIKMEMAQEIIKFLWEGRNSNHKRFHLVNWKIVRAPKAHGGLGVKDPVLGQTWISDPNCCGE